MNKTFWVQNEILTFTDIFCEYYLNRIGERKWVWWLRTLLGSIDVLDWRAIEGKISEKNLSDLLQTKETNSLNKNNFSLHTLHCLKEIDFKFSSWFSVFFHDPWLLATLIESYIHSCILLPKQHELATSFAAFPTPSASFPDDTKNNTFFSEANEKLIDGIIEVLYFTFALQKSDV